MSAHNDDQDPGPFAPGAASRREFLKRSSAMSALGVAAPWALNLAAIGEAAAQAGGDYKALVCVFLYGGNDHGNTLVPYDEATHAQYTSLRAGLGTARSALGGTVLTPSTALPGGLQYALAPQLGKLKPLFDARVMAPLLNVGPLVQPTTKAQYNARSVPLPPRLFSHNDQQSVWQAGTSEGATTGWGGRIGDLFAAGNGQSVFTAVSVSGNAVYLSGEYATQYQVSTAGSVAINGIGSSLYGSSAASQALRQIVSQPGGSHVMQMSHAEVVRRSIDADVLLRASLAAAPPIGTVFPATPLGSQLAMAARMISARAALGTRRQVFFVSLGGFDNHDGLLGSHPALLTQVGDAMAAFYQATVELGVAANVTSFTASDFGRTLTSNGDGSDHGWGAYHFVLGGAVKGGRYYGSAPLLGDGGADDVGQGRMLPTMAVDQLASTFATWMGVAGGELPTVVPGIGNFTVRDLGIFG
jgi:uncharacterized protein (DUF1501 family)